MNNIIFEKLKYLHVPNMALQYSKQLEDPNSDLKKFDDRFLELVEAEYDARVTKRINRDIKKATLRYPGADLDESLYEKDRNLDVDTIKALSELSWIDEGRNILITGATGAGKSYLANALLLIAIRNRYKVKYIKTSSLIHELEKAETESILPETIAKYYNYDVLAIDDFGLMELDINKCRNLFELIDSRESKKSIIVISQLPVTNWYELFKDNTYADACMDRLIHKAYRIEMNGTNMRNKDK